MGNCCPQETAEPLYHGSPANITDKYLKPSRSNVLAGEAAVFATADRALALTFMARWGDADLDLGYINGQLTMEEKRRNAFRDVFAGKSAYLYRVSDRGFQHDPRLMPAEQIRRKRTTIVSKTRIDNVWDELRQAEVDGEIELVYFPDN